MVSPLGFHSDERVAAFIDGPNLYSAGKTLGFDVDYDGLIRHLEDNSKFLRAYYYTAVAETADEYNPIRPLLDFLAYNGYQMVTKPLKKFTDETGRQRAKGDMNIEIAVDMLNLADRIDHAILFSGDGNFTRLVEAMQAKGVRVTVISTKEGQSGAAADELRRQADRFIDLLDLKDDFARKPKDAHR